MRLAHIARLAGRIPSDVWQRCSGLSTARQSPRGIRNTWMVDGYDWHGLPVVPGRVTQLDALSGIHACRNAAKVPVRKAIRHRTRGDGAECHRLYALLKENRWGEDFCLHRQMQKCWQGGTSRVTSQIVLEPGACTVQAWHGRPGLPASMERGQRPPSRFGKHGCPPALRASSCRITAMWKSITS